MTRKPFLAAGLCLLLGAPASLAVASPPPQVWFAPGTDIPSKRGAVRADFLDLFSSSLVPPTPSQWPYGSDHVDVWQMDSHWIINPERASPRDAAQQQNAFKFMAEHHIALSLKLAGVTPAELTDLTGGEKCGPLEGVRARPKSLENELTKVRDALGSYVSIVKYASFDEPLFFASDFGDDGSDKASRACNFTPQVVATGVARSMKLIQQYFPGVKFSEGEPMAGLSGGAPRNGVAPSPGNSAYPDGPSELIGFLQALQKATGGPLLPVRFDIHWFPNQRHRMDWRDQRRGLPAFIRALTSIHDSYGIILNASAVDPSTGINYNETNDSVAWVRSAEHNLVAFRALLASNPDLPPPSHMVIQSWDRSPANLLPETDATGAPNPATLTGLLLYYLRTTPGSK